MSEIVVHATPLREDRISPLVYGEFVEFLNDLVPGMWADKLQDRAFAGMAQPQAIYREDPQAGRREWRAFRCGMGPYGAPVEGEATLEFDPVDPFIGERSPRVTFTGGAGYIGGILQSGIAVRAGQRLDFKGWFRAAGFGGAVKLLVGRDYGAFFEVYDSCELTGETPVSTRRGTIARDGLGIGAEWGRVEGSLVSSVTDDEACFAIALEAPGTVWIGKVSLMPEDAVEGWRADVVAAVKASKPGVIRFGGSSLIYYDWETGVGRRERRAPFVNQPWGNTEEHDVGLAEFLRFCQLVEAEPLICVNSNSSSPEHIAHEIEYCNGNSTTEYGQRRAQDGYPAPFAVRYWQIGNEQSGSEYEERLPEFVRAMKAADPTISLLADYPSDRIINEQGGDFDFICPHYYGPDVVHWTRETDDLRRRVAASPCNPRLKLGITEWNHTAGDWGDQRAWLLTLYNGLHVARMLNLYQRNSDLVAIANRSNLCNSACSGSLQTDATGLYVTPAYHVQALYANESGDVPLRVETGEGEGLDVMATYDERRGRVCVTVVNYGGEARSRSLRLEGFVLGGGSVSVTTLAGASPAAVNSRVDPERVRPMRREVARETLSEYEFAPYSLTVMAVEARRG